jgi:hypothetical protein
MNIAGRLDAAKNSSHETPGKLDKSTTIRLENQYGHVCFVPRQRFCAELRYCRNVTYPPKQCMLFRKNLYTEEKLFVLQYVVIVTKDQPGHREGGN